MNFHKKIAKANLGQRPFVETIKQLYNLVVNGAYLWGKVEGNISGLGSSLFNCQESGGGGGCLKGSSRWHRVWRNLQLGFGRPREYTIRFDDGGVHHADDVLMAYVQLGFGGGDDLHSVESSCSAKGFIDDN